MCIFNDIYDITILKSPESKEKWKFRLKQNQIFELFQIMIEE